MIDVYTTSTANSQRPMIMLEEVGLPYRKHFVDREKKEQRRPEFLAINPLGALPVIIDHDAPGGPLTVTQSTAILMYLRDKTGKLLPRGGRARAETMECTILAIQDLHGAITQIFIANQRMEAGPGRDWALKFHGERLDKYLTECERRIATRGGWLAGEYSIADIIAFAPLNAPANYPRIRDNPAFGALRDWHARIAARPAVQRGIAATAP